MAITQLQVSGAVATTKSLQNTLFQLQDLLNTVNYLINNNWQIKTTVTGATVSSAVSTTDQATLLNQYNVLKAQLVTIFNQLP